MNNSQEIILAQISAIYDKPPFVKVKTGQMEMILKCVGLGKYYDEYAKYLEPYWYNRGFQNDIESYRIFVGLNSIFEDLLNAHEPKTWRNPELGVCGFGAARPGYLFLRARKQRTGSKNIWNR